jgi:putative MFS transporter
VVAFVVGYFFIDGGFANLAPSTPEVFPTHLRSHSSGLAETVNGFGKILGPLGLAVIAGTSNIVNPEATREAITPALYFLAAFSLMTAFAFLLIPETRKKTLEEVEEELEAQRQPALSKSK